MYKFYIEQNTFLRKKAVKGYYHQYYTGYKQKDNPDFINTLKNTFNSEQILNLKKAQQKVINILMVDIPYIMRENNLYNCICISVPRSKSLKTYKSTQLFFKNAVGIVANSLDRVVDGTNYIQRIRNTYTTHLDKATRNGKILNDGDKPYEGITIDTCNINTAKIKGNNIILIDDIYTKNINVDEDCIQALFDNGAKNIVFYSIGYTRRF